MGLILSPLKGLDDSPPASAGGIADAGQLITLSPFVFPPCSVGRLVSCTPSVTGRSKRVFKGFLVAIKTWQYLLTQIWLNITFPTAVWCKKGTEGEKNPRKNYREPTILHETATASFFSTCCFRANGCSETSTRRIPICHILHLGNKTKKTHFPNSAKENWNTLIIKNKKQKQS